MNGKAARLRIPTGERIGGGRRGKIKSFTADASRRLQFSMQSIDSARHPRDRFWFLTLTYRVRSREERPTPAGAKKHLHRFTQELRRHYGGVGGLWKIEPHKKGAPHFHCVLFVPVEVDPLQLHWWIARAWNRIAGQGDPAHLGVHAHGDSFQHLRTWEGVTSYCAKYLGKIEGNGDPLWQWPGKMWGWVNKRALTITIEEEELARPVAVRVRRYLGRWMDRQPTGRYRVEDPDREPGSKLYRMRIKREYLGRSQVNQLRSFGYLVRPYHRRRRRSYGGLSCFLSDATFKRMIDHAMKEVTDGTTTSEAAPAARENAAGGWPRDGDRAAGGRAVQGARGRAVETVTQFLGRRADADVSEGPSWLAVTPAAGAGARH